MAIIQAFSIFPVGVVLCTQAVEHNEATFPDLSFNCLMMARKASTMSISANMIPWSLSPVTVADNLMEVVPECLHYEFCTV